MYFFRLEFLIRVTETVFLSLRGDGEMTFKRWFSHILLSLPFVEKESHVIETSTYEVMKIIWNIIYNLWKIAC
jgi:hypothetical protein